MCSFAVEIMPKTLNFLNSSGSLRSRFILEKNILWLNMHKINNLRFFQQCDIAMCFNIRGPNIEMLPTPLVWC